MHLYFQIWDRVHTSANLITHTNGNVLRLAQVITSLRPVSQEVNLNIVMLNGMREIFSYITSGLKWCSRAQKARPFLQEVVKFVIFTPR